MQKRRNMIGIAPQSKIRMYHAVQQPLDVNSDFHFILRSVEFPTLAMQKLPLYTTICVVSLQDLFLIPLLFKSQQKKDARRTVYVREKIKCNHNFRSEMLSKLMFKSIQNQSQGCYRNYSIQRDVPLKSLQPLEKFI